MGSISFIFDTMGAADGARAGVGIREDGREHQREGGTREEWTIKEHVTWWKAIAMECVLRTSLKTPSAVGSSSERQRWLYLDTRDVS